MVLDSGGSIVAEAPGPSLAVTRALDALRRGPPPRSLTATIDGVIEVAPAEGIPMLVAAHALEATLGGVAVAQEIAVVQPRAHALAAWRSDTVLTVTLFATTGFVLLILGFAFHWQAMRAR